jgi:hypothetical protein
MEACMIVSEGFNTYKEKDGKRELTNPEQASMQIGDEYLFRFDGKSGELELSMSETDIEALVQAHGGLPIPQLRVPAPFEQPILQNVQKIVSLPTARGLFLIKRSPQTIEQPRRSLFARIFG